MNKILKLNNMRFAIGFSFFYIIVYSFSLLFNISMMLDLMMMRGFPLIEIWVVISILKDKNVPKKTFEEYFYQDEDIKRNI
jgi:hypothetical protein